MDEDDEFGSDIEYNEDLENALQAAESQQPVALPGDPQREHDSPIAVDIEDVIQQSLSPFDEFRKRGWLSVSDLVGTIWCELQYDYRLRTLPYLPPSQRPTVIKSTQGNDIVVDKIKVEGKERILKRGDKIHKRLEKELHPEQIVVKATTREDVWGLKLLNMICGLESLITLGKCREMPVVGFVDGMFVMGIIDELSRERVDRPSQSPDKTQKSILSFFPSLPAKSVPRTHRVILSDSKTRASGTLPRESDTKAGRLQCMLYKELLDATLRAPDTEVPKEGLQILPTRQDFSFAKVFALLDLAPKALFSDSFVHESRPVVEGNELQYGAEDARCLNDLVQVWYSYVEQLGLGHPSNSKSPDAGVTENRLELVYRRASRVKDRRSKESSDEPMSSQESVDEEKQVQLAIAASLQDSNPAALATAPASGGKDPPSPSSSLSDADPDAEQVDEELLLAIEMSVADREPAETDEVALPVSQRVKESAPSTPRKPKAAPTTPAKSPKNASGSIIGRHNFQHNQAELAHHLESVLQFWLGKREPVGVDIANTNRCGWCEFEEGCEWRQKKADEAMARFRAQRKS